jgi:hypothetical protein
MLFGLQFALGFPDVVNDILPTAASTAVTYPMLSEQSRQMSFASSPISPPASSVGTPLKPVPRSRALNDSEATVWLEEIKQIPDDGPK